MFGRKKKDTNNAAQAALNGLEACRQGVKINDEAIQYIKGEMQRIVTNVNTSLQYMADQQNAMQIQINHLAKEIRQTHLSVEKNLEIFKECSVRMQLIQSLTHAFPDPNRRLQEAQKMTDFVLHGQSSPAGQEGNVVSLRAVEKDPPDPVA